MQRSVTLEIAVDCEADAAVAAASGADRLELCADLADHGFTPDPALVRTAARLPTVSTVAMVRPVSDDPGSRCFVWSNADWNTVVGHAARLLSAGADGIVFACLSPDWQVDQRRVREMVAIAQDRETVFHRAIDLTPDPLESSLRLADLGVTRVLTAGMSQFGTAAELRAGPLPGSISHPGRQDPEIDSWPQRLSRLSEFVRIAGPRIQILPGGGVRAANVAELLSRTSCSQVHSSARVAGKFDAAAVAGLRAAIDAAR